MGWKLILKKMVRPPSSVNREREEKSKNAQDASNAGTLGIGQTSAARPITPGIAQEVVGPNASTPTSSSPALQGKKTSVVSQIRGGIVGGHHQGRGVQS